MIHFKNHSLEMGVPFEEYLKWDGYSNSFLKGEKDGEAQEVKQTDKITFGSLVDNILTDPVVADVTDERFEEARDCATEIIKYFGELAYKVMRKQVSVKADMFNEQKNLIMPVKGRIDFLYNYVTDLKVTEVKEKELMNLIKFMGYDRQIFFYDRIANLNMPFGYIVFYLRKEKRIVVRKVEFNATHEEYFYSKLLKFGI